MAAQAPALCLLLMVGMWAGCRHRGAALGPGEKPTLRLSGGGCRCTGLLEVQMWSGWSPVCWDGVSQDSVCQQLDCGPPTKLNFMPPNLEEQQAWAMRCEGMERCHWVAANCSQQAIIACSEPEPTRTEPPPVPPTTSPEPTGAPWLRLVDGNFSCSGFVELHLRGRWGAVALSPDVWPELPTRICRALGCNNPSGIPIGVTVGDTVDIPIGGPVDRPVSLPSESRLPVRWEAVVPCTSPELLDCFSWTSPGHKKASTFLICPGTPCRARPPALQGAALWGPLLQRRAAGLPCQWDHLQGALPPPLSREPQGGPRLLSHPCGLPDVEATSCWHRTWHSGQHLPGPAPAGSPAAHLWSPCLQEADEEDLQEEAAAVDRPHGTAPERLLPPQQHCHPEGKSGGAEGAGEGQ
ncbi:T-cell surface glycoprotein CD5 isoform X3 [Lagopus muta]|uniref:T-cell surface glycoprotein CD5 isoform X3 n=1 Tax=Lagopus muta TaxID=64668 RepID=UPI00209EC44E|nr:T-cell surface glycoprotein CD5 isoform X3 [Lagopus muta]